MNPLQDSAAYRAKQIKLAALLSQLQKNRYEKMAANQEQQKARSTLEQITMPIIGAIGNTFGGAVTGMAQLGGTAVEALTPWNQLGQNIRNTGNTYRDALESAIANSRFSTIPRPGENSFITNLSSGLGSLAASMGTYGLTKSAKLPALMFGASAGGEQARAAVEAGKSPMRALLTGAAGGGFEAGLEKIGLERYMKAGGSLLPRLATRMATEGTQESLQSLAQSAVSATHSKVDLAQALKQAGTEGMYGALVGGIGGAGANVPLAVKRAAMNVRETPLLSNKIGAIGRDVKPDQLESLKAEARKYKSAEEFVKAQGESLYHGSNSKWEGPFKQPTKGEYGSEAVFLAPSERGGEYYVRDLAKGEVKQAFIDKGAKIWDFRNPKDLQLVKDFVNKNGLKEIDPTWIAGNEEWLKGIESGRYSLIQRPAIMDLLRKNGYDGFRNIDHYDYGADISTGIFNADKVKTKSQLTSLWNEANAPQVGGTPLLPAVAQTPTQQQNLRDILAQQRVLKGGEYNVGITNVAGKSTTQSDIGWQEALGKGEDLTGAAQKSVQFGIDQLNKAFQGSNIKIKATPGFGVFEGTPEPSIDLRALIPAGSEAQFHATLADLGMNKFNQRSVITYHDTPGDEYGWVDKKRGISNEPSVRIQLTEAQAPDSLTQLNELMDKHDLPGASFKDGGKTIDILNLSYYNEDYETFVKNATAFSKELESRGIVQSIDFSVSEVRHFGDEKEAPETYQRVQSEYAKTQGATYKTDQSVTSKILERLPKKEMISRPEVESIVRMKDITEIERDVAQRAMDSIDWNKPSLLPNGARNGRIPTGQFIEAFDKLLLPTESRHTERWANYGLDNLNLNIYAQPMSVVITTPVQHGHSGHFTDEDMAGRDFGHYRMFNVDDPYTRYTYEVTVAKQKLNEQKRMLKPDDTETNRKYTQMEIDRYQRQLDDIKGKLKGLERTPPTAYVAEIQSDAFQQGSIDQGRVEYEKRHLEDDVATIKAEIAGIKQEMKLKAKPQSDLDRRYFDRLGETVDGKEKRLAFAEERLKAMEGIEKPGSQSKQLENFARDNKYRRRLIEEVLLDLQDKGYEVVMLPTPSTVATVEWNYAGGDGVPYEDGNGDRINPREFGDLEAGDYITYGGESYMVVEATEDGIEVAPSDKVQMWSRHQGVEDSLQPRIDDVEYELREYLNRGLKPEYASELLDESWDEPVRMTLEIISEQDEIIRTDSFWQNIEPKLRDKLYDYIDDNFDDELKGIYGEGHVFIETDPTTDNRRETDTKVYVLETDSSTESFNQPTYYEGGMDRGELLELDKNKSAAMDEFDEDQMGVLNNYYELPKILAKIQKDSDIAVEYVEIDNEDLDPVSWYKVTLNKNLKRTAF